MKILEALKVSLIIIVTSSLQIAQISDNRKNELQKVVTTKPGVYMSFVRYEDYRPRKTGRTNHRLAWVRIHNNMTSPIRFCSYDESVSPNAKAGAIFEFERVPDYTRPSSRDNSSVPFGMIGVDVCNEFTLSKGQTFDFALVIDKYISETRIKVRFFYPWEDVFEAVTGKEPEHFVYFYLRDLL